MHIKILEDIGWGYSKLAVVVDAALKKIGLAYKVEIIGNPKMFNKYNVLDTPALIINNKNIVEGYVPSLEKMINIFKSI